LGEGEEMTLRLVRKGVVPSVAFLMLNSFALKGEIRGGGGRNLVDSLEGGGSFLLGRRGT